MPPLLTPTEWMFRVLMDHFKCSGPDKYLEVFVRCYSGQGLPGCVQFPVHDYWDYTHNGRCIPPYVYAQYYELCPWLRPCNAEEDFTLALAAE